MSTSRRKTVSTSSAERSGRNRVSMNRQKEDLEHECEHEHKYRRARVSKGEEGSTKLAVAAGGRMRELVSLRLQQCRCLSIAHRLHLPTAPDRSPPSAHRTVWPPHRSQCPPALNPSHCSTIVQPSVRLRAVFVALRLQKSPSSVSRCAPSPEGTTFSLLIGHHAQRLHVHH